MKYIKYINTVKAQFYMMLHKKSFWISFFLMFLYALGYHLFFIYSYWQGKITKTYSGSCYFVGRFSDLPCVQLFTAAFPLIVTLTFSFTFYEERKSGVWNYTILRTGAKYYYTGKAAVAFLGNFIVITIPYLCNILLNSLVFPEIGVTFYGCEKEPLYYLNLLENGHMPFMSFYIQHTVVYLILYSVFLGIFAGILGCFSYVTGLFVRQGRVIIFVPLYLLFYLTEHYPRYFGGLKLNQIIVLDSQWGKNYGGLFVLFCLGILVVTGLLLFWKCRKTDDILKA